MPKPLSEHSIDDLKRLAVNYRAAGVTEGKHFTLADIMREIDRRQGGALTLDNLTSIIATSCLTAPERKVSYRELYLAMHGQPPAQGFVGNGWRIPLTSKLRELSELCHAHGWPLISILVVDNKTRRLTTDTETAFYHDWKDKYPIKAVNAEKWCQQMTEQALEFVRRHPGSFGPLAA